MSTPHAGHVWSKSFRPSMQKGMHMLQQQGWGGKGQGRRSVWCISGLLT